MAMIEGDAPRTVDEKVAQRTTEIAERIDPAKTQSLTAGTEFGGVRIENMLQVMEMAKLMAVSQQAVPSHLRANPGMCLAICLQAVEWKMSPFAVANKSYVTNDRLNYESQLVHAVIEARAPLQRRLEVSYEGVGEDRVCIVSGLLKGETTPRSHRSPPLKELKPPLNDYGKVKGSPLWLKKPDVQMFYDTSRDWIRIFVPDVLLGIYTPDELEQYDVGTEARDVGGTTLADRLKAKSGDHPAEGYRDGVVEAGLNGDLGHAPGATETAVGEPAPETPANPAPKSRKRATAAPAKAAGAPEPDPKPSEPKAEPVTEGQMPHAEPVPMPTNAATYTAWFKEWLANLDDEADISDRWSAEKKLRNACGITADERKPLEELKAARIAELKG